MRRITTHHKRNFDNEELAIITVYEEQYKKQSINKENPYCKSHEILVKYGNRYEFLRKKA